MCIFCKIINGEIPSYKIYEDENVLAFLDIADDYEGHTLVIPKKHYENIFEIPVEELSKVMEVVKKISNHYVSNLNFEGINICNANGECAEQTVPHFHIHIIPRKAGDGKKFYSENEKVGSDFAILCERLKLK